MNEGLELIREMRSYLDTLWCVRADELAHKAHIFLGNECVEDIKSLLPKDLDAAVAEEVLGWERANSLSFYNTSKEVVQPMFTVTLDAAWRVVNTMRGKGYRYTIFSASKDGVDSRAEFLSPDSKHIYSITGSHVPTIICQAALWATRANDI